MARHLLSGSWLVGRVIPALLLSALYVALYHVSEALIDQEVVGGVASLLFLPAVVRLLGFLLVDFWIIPALFLAALACVDLHLAWPDRIVVSAFLALGGPLGTAAVAAFSGLKPSLSNLTPRHLLGLSIGCSLGSALAYNLSLALVGIENLGLRTQLATFIGDSVGTWIAIYAIKFGVDLLGSARAH